MNGKGPDVIKEGFPEIVIGGIVKVGVGDEWVFLDFGEQGKETAVLHFLGMQDEGVGPRLVEGGDQRFRFGGIFFTQSIFETHGPIVASFLTILARDGEIFLKKKGKSVLSL